MYINEELQIIIVVYMLCMTIAYIRHRSESNWSCWHSLYIGKQPCKRTNEFSIFEKSFL